MSAAYQTTAKNSHSGMAKRKRPGPFRQSKKVKVGRSKSSSAELVQNDSALADEPPASTQLRQSRNPTCSETEKQKLERIATTLVEVHAGLTRCKNHEGLSPSPKVNGLFTRLVVTCKEIASDALESAILNDNRVKAVKDDIRQYSSDGEGLMEAFHAKRMIGELEQSLESKPDLTYEKRWKILKTFPYYQNYVDLTRMEKSIIESLFDIGKPPQSYVFIGSGPMPLTAMCLAYLMELERPSVASMLHLHLTPGGQSPGDSLPTPPSVRIHNVDCDNNAIELSTTLVNKIGGPLRYLTFECRAAEITIQKKAYEQFDVVYLAALVGNTLEKKLEITKEVLSNMKEGSVLVLRSAHNLRKLLYEPVDLARVAEVTTDDGLGLNVVRVVHPTDEVVNSVVVCRVVDTNKRKC